jgi:hypothetical protein
LIGFCGPNSDIRPCIAQRQGYAGTGRKLEAAVQEILAQICHAQLMSAVSLLTGLAP